MAKSLFIILVSLCITTNISLGEDVCSDYDDKDCVRPEVTKHSHYANQWSVHLPGMTKEEARKMLESKGFIYLGKVTIFFTSIIFKHNKYIALLDICCVQIMDSEDLYLVTKPGTLEKHAMPNEQIIELLKKHEKVE